MEDPVITIAIPVFNSEKTIAESVESAISQKLKWKKEVLVIDDGSTDRTVEIVSRYPVRLVVNAFNVGIGKNLEFLMKKAKGKYVIYLCGDDQFVDDKVVSDYVRVFKSNEKLGMIGRYYYQYMNGHPGPIMVSRDKNILTHSCNPSGMAFVRDRHISGTNKIFIECPSIVKHYLLNGWEWTMFEYDTIKARIHPGGNTGTKKEYYKGSMFENWRALTGEPFKFYQGFIQIKNRAPGNLWGEICQSLKGNQKALLDPTFWFYVIVAVVVPGFVLRPLSNFYRHRITRRFLKIKERPNVCM